MLGTPCLLVLGGAGNGIKALRKLGKCSIMESLHPDIMMGAHKVSLAAPLAPHTHIQIG